MIFYSEKKEPDVYKQQIAKGEEWPTVMSHQSVGSIKWVFPLSTDVEKKVNDCNSVSFTANSFFFHQ